MTAFAPGVTPLPGAAAAARRSPEGGLRGCLIRGAPLSGKSSLALSLVALGGVLVSDDVVGLSGGGPVSLHAPLGRLAGLLHLREAGVMRLPHVETAPLDFVVDLIPRPVGPARPASGGSLRAPGVTQLLGVGVPCHEIEVGPATAAAVFCLLGGAEIIDPDKI